MLRIRSTLALAAALITSAAAAATAQSAPPTRCVDEATVERNNGIGSSDAEPMQPEDPRMQLQTLVRDAVTRSQAVGAAKLLAEAAVDDIAEVNAQRKPTVMLNGGVNAGSTHVNGYTDNTGAQARAGFNVTAPLYDSGRIGKLADWRGQLAEAARQGQITTTEQIAFQAVSLALERARYRLQVQVYQQYARKMGCLVEALEQIVSVDKGRHSELVQARKTLQQAELSVVQARSNVRQSEVRLRRFVGDGLPTGQGLSSVLTRLPQVEAILAQSDNSSEIAALGAQANAAERYAEALAAARKPQVNWTFGGTGTAGGRGVSGNPKGWSAGINVSVPLYDPTAEPQTSAAQKRAAAARLQQADALEARRSRVLDVYEQASSNFERAKRIVDTLRDSERVRNFTLQQWQQLGKRSLFDVMSAEGDHYNLRIAYVNALYDGQQSNALLWSLGGGIHRWLQ